MLYLGMSSKRPSNFDQILDQIESGKMRDARRILRNWPETKIAPPERMQAARLYFRAGMLQRVLKLLNPAIYPEKKVVKPATDVEKALYAASLVGYGSLQEAEQVFNSAKNQKTFAILFQRSFLHFRQARWIEGKAEVLHLEKVLEQKGLLTTRWKFFLSTSLIITAIHGDKDYKAASLLLKWARTAVKDDFQDRKLNVFQLSIQNELFLGTLKRAGELIAEARGHYNPKSKSNMVLLLRQWEAMYRFRCGGTKRAFIKTMDELADGFQANNHWSFRTYCFFYRAVETRDWDLLHQLYFSSDIAGFRELVVEELPKSHPVPQKYALKLLNPTKKDPLIDTTSCGLKGGQILDRLFHALANTRLRSIHLVELHHYLYPGGHYNPFSSPNQIHQAIIRLRQWFLDKKYPLTISQKNGYYSLIATSPCTLTLHQEIPETQSDRLLDTLENQFKRRPFSAREASAHSNHSPRTVGRALREAVLAGVLQKEGAGPSTRYAFS